MPVNKRILCDVWIAADVGARTVGIFKFRVFIDVVFAPEQPAVVAILHGVLSALNIAVIGFDGAGFIRTGKVNIILAVVPDDRIDHNRFRSGVVFSGCGNVNAAAIVGFAVFYYQVVKRRT